MSTVRKHKYSVVFTILLCVFVIFMFYVMWKHNEISWNFIALTLAGFANGWRAFLRHRILLLEDGIQPVDLWLFLEQDPMNMIIYYWTIAPVSTKSKNEEIVSLVKKVNVITYVTYALLATVLLLAVTH